MREIKTHAPAQVVIEEDGETVYLCTCGKTSASESLLSEHCTKANQDNVRRAMELNNSGTANR